MTLIGALGILQLMEGRLPILEGARGRLVYILFQFAIGWVLIGYSGGIESTYYLVFLFPMVSAADLPRHLRDIGDFDRRVRGVFLFLSVHRLGEAVPRAGSD